MPSSNDARAVRPGPYGQRFLDLAFAVLFAAGLLLPTALTVARTGDPVLLNEVLVSHNGDDTTEFVELYGAPGTPLDGYVVVAVEGDGTSAGTIDVRLEFPAGARLGGNGFFLVGNPVGLAHYGVTPDLAVTTTAAAGFFENGSQTIVLADRNSVGAAGTAVSGTEVVHDAVALTDAGPTDSFFFGAPVVGPDDGFMPAGARRVTDGVDTDTPADWAFADELLGPENTPTPATPYDAPPSATCGPSMSTVSGVPATAPVSATDPDGRVTSFSLVATPDPGGISLGPATPAGSAGATATTTVEVAGTTKAGTYAVVVTAWTDGVPAQQASCTISVLVEAPPPPPPAPGGTANVDALSAALADLVTQGLADARKAALLQDHLDKVTRFVANGQAEAASAQLQAFANQLAGMTPRWIQPDAAASLATLAQEVAASL
ncbi:MAG TPA: hypothetical protein VF013_09280 [Candidatus Limnocylindria bacterium]